MPPMQQNEMEKKTDPKTNKTISPRGNQGSIQSVSPIKKEPNLLKINQENSKITSIQSKSNTFKASPPSHKPALSNSVAE
jgi:hypothetical protein